MGDILFHLSGADEDLVQRHILGARLTPAERSEAQALAEMIELNKLFAKADTQKSVDGYGVEDRSKL